MKNKLIKTKCGLEKYNQLKQRQTLFGKLRLFWFVIFATLRDYRK